MVPLPIALRNASSKPEQPQQPPRTTVRGGQKKSKNSTCGSQRIAQEAFMHAQVHTRAGRPVRSSLTLACRLVGFARFFFLQRREPISSIPTHIRSHSFCPPLISCALSSRARCFGVPSSADTGKIRLIETAAARTHVSREEYRICLSSSSGDATKRNLWHCFSLPLIPKRCCLVRFLPPFRFLSPVFHS